MPVTGKQSGDQGMPSGNIPGVCCNRHSGETLHRSPGRSNSHHGEPSLAATFRSIPLRLSRWSLAFHVFAGAALGVILLHPVSMVIHWLDMLASGGTTTDLVPAVLQRLATAFSVRMLPMTGLFALLGGAVGAGFGAYHRTRMNGYRAPTFGDRELSRDVLDLLRLPEGECLEFKSSARWDTCRNGVNKEVTHALVKSIAGFLNHEGGSILVGVDDRGEVLGLRHDLCTLKRKDSDGFQQFMVGMVRSRLGGHVCPLVHFGFSAVAGKVICRILVEPSPAPVYCRDPDRSRYFVRTGNGTRELDAREAVEHIGQRPRRRTNR